MKLEAIYVFSSHRLNVYDNGVTASLFASDGLTTIDNAQKSRPCIDGDVLSVDPAGQLVGRPAGTNGPYEVAKKTSKGLLYSPEGNNGRSYLVPYAE